LREARKLRVFENRVLKKVYGPKRDEVKGQWRRLHNEELYDLYFPSNQIMNNEMGGEYSKHGIQDRCIQNIGGGNPEKERPLGKTQT
jgi:hypothetical protein